MVTLIIALAVLFIGVVTLTGMLLIKCALEYLYERF